MRDATPCGGNAPEPCSQGGHDVEGVERKGATREPSSRRKAGRAVGEARRGYSKGACCAAGSKRRAGAGRGVVLGGVGPQWDGHRRGRWAGAGLCPTIDRHKTRRAGPGTHADRTTPTHQHTKRQGSARRVSLCAEVASWERTRGRPGKGEEEGGLRTGPVKKQPAGGRQQAVISKNGSILLGLRKWTWTTLLVIPDR